MAAIRPSSCYACDAPPITEDQVAALEAHFEHLEAKGPAQAEVGLVSKTRDEKTWVVSFRRDNGPTE